MNIFSKLKILQNLPSVCLICHENPDADALSSVIVFREFLMKHMNVRNVDIFADGALDIHRYGCILGKVVPNKIPKKYSASIILDSASTDITGKYASLFLDSPLKIVIDHHNTNLHQGDINIVKIVSSTCEIIYYILKYFKFDISKENQGKLYAGLITDTNNFVVGKINSKTHKMASELIENIDSNAIYEHFLANNTLLNMQALSKAINNIKIYNEGKIIVSYISNDDDIKLGTSQEDYSGIINKLATIKNNKFVLFIYPRNNQYYVSMRAKQGYDVSIIAKNHGGGGHSGASAFYSSDNIKRIINNVVLEFATQLKIKDTKYSNFKF